MLQSRSMRRSPQSRKRLRCLRIVGHGFLIDCCTCARLSPSMLSKGQHILRAWNEGCGVSIDGSERSHAQHRADMKSNGRARSSTVASNRVFVQSVRADMIRRDMRDPGLPPSALSPSSSSVASCSAEGGKVPGARQQRQRHGGNPLFRVSEPHQ